MRYLDWADNPEEEMGVLFSLVNRRFHSNAPIYASAPAIGVVR